MNLLSLFLLLFQTPNGQLSNQQLIDIAPPGSIVTLDGQGPFADIYPRTVLRIDKPLTVIGNGTWVRNIYLDGPGHGEVVLHGINASHRHFCIDNCMDPYEWAPHGANEGAIIATGFDSVKLYECSANGRVEVHGASLVTLERTDLAVFDDHPALTAPGATVVLLDSGLVNMRGAAPGLDTAGALYCTRVPPMPDGIPTFQLGQGLTMTGSSRLGDVLELDWRGFGYGVLWADVGVRAPRAAWGGSWSFLGDSPIFIRLAQQAKVPIPDRRDLIGLEVTFQATDFGGRYSRPAFALIRP